MKDIENKMEKIIEWIIIIAIISLIMLTYNLLSLFVALELLNITIYIYIYPGTYNNNINIIRYYIISSISSILYIIGMYKVYEETGELPLGGGSPSRRNYNKEYR
jgi:NADH:ubiquinone oxidoreductase subunit 2 (subunit N)